MLGNNSKGQFPFSWMGGAGTASDILEQGFYDPQNDIVLYNGGARLSIGTQTGSPTEFNGGYASYGYDSRYHFESGIVVAAGETLYCTDVNAHPEVTVSGYFVTRNKVRCFFSFLN